MPPPKSKPAPPVNVPPPLERYAEVGDPVFWYPGADAAERPHAAVVTKLGHENQIVANVFDSTLMGVTPQDGCRHMDDPKALIDNSGGGWRPRPLELAARRLLLTMGLVKWVEQKDGTFVLVEVEDPPAAKPGPDQARTPAA